MGAELIALFTDMGWVSAILLSLGILFCIIEMFIPGVGFFGISGAILVIAGIIARAVEGATLNQILLMILLTIGALFVFMMIMIGLSKIGWLNNGLINSETAISSNYDYPSKEFINLITEQGTTITDLKPVGKVKIKEKVYQCKSLDGYIDKGTKVIVDSISKNEIRVKLTGGK